MILMQILPSDSLEQIFVLYKSYSDIHVNVKDFTYKKVFKTKVFKYFFMISFLLYIFIDKQCSTQQNCFVCCIFSLFNFRTFSSWVVQVFLLEYCMITHRISCLVFKLVLSVICRFHNLWPPHKIPLLFRLGHKISFMGGDICRLSMNVTWCHDNHHMNTSADVLKFTIRNNDL